MTIVEELDKKSGRAHRSKNIVDAMKYAFDLEKTPQNIAEATKMTWRTVVAEAPGEPETPTEPEDPGTPTK